MSGKSCICLGKRNMFSLRGDLSKVASLFCLPLLTTYHRTLQPEKWPTVLRTGHGISLLLFTWAMPYTQISPHIRFQYPISVLKTNSKYHSGADLSSLWFPIAHSPCMYLLYSSCEYLVSTHNAFYFPLWLTMPLSFPSLSTFLTPYWIVSSLKTDIFSALYPF